MNKQGSDEQASDNEAAKKLASSWQSEADLGVLIEMLKDGNEDLFAQVRQLLAVNRPLPSAKEALSKLCAEVMSGNLKLARLLQEPGNSAVWKQIEPRVESRFQELMELGLLPSARTEVTRLLQKAGKLGSVDALHDLLVKCLSELESLAESKFRRSPLSRPDSGPASLLNVSVARILDTTRFSPQNREEFRGLVSLKMQQVLLDDSRSRMAREGPGNKRRWEREDTEAESVGDRLEAASLTAKAAVEARPVRELIERIYSVVQRLRPAEAAMLTEKLDDASDDYIRVKHKLKSIATVKRRIERARLLFALALVAAGFTKEDLLWMARPKRDSPDVFLYSWIFREQETTSGEIAARALRQLEAEHPSRAERLADPGTKPVKRVVQEYDIMYGAMQQLRLRHPPDASYLERFLTDKALPESDDERSSLRFSLAFLDREMAARHLSEAKRMFLRLQF